MAEAYWSYADPRQLNAAATAVLPVPDAKRPRTEMEAPGGNEMSKYYTSEDGRIVQRVITDTDPIGASYDNYLRRTQMQVQAGNEPARPMNGGMSGHPVSDPRAAGIGVSDPRAAGIGVSDPRAAVGIRVSDQRFAGIGVSDQRVASIGVSDQRFSGIGVSDPALALNSRGMIMSGGGRYELPLPPDASSTLFVEGLPADCTRREVSHIFRPFVGYKEVRLVTKDSKRSGGDPLVLCFVDFVSPAHAATAMDALEGTLVQSFSACALSLLWPYIPVALCRNISQSFLVKSVCCNYVFLKPPITIINNVKIRGGGGISGGSCGCSAIAIEAPSSFSHVSNIRWGSARQQGPRDEMEDDLLVIQSEDSDAFAFAAVFDGHAGFSSVKFLRNELYRECSAALQGGILTKDTDLDTIRKALQEAFESADLKLMKWLETTSGEDVESGSTATAIFINNNMVFISHVGDSSVVISRCGKAEKLTNSHRPYGSDKVSLQEIRRIREAGGWINNGRICGDIAVSRAFGDMRFKTKKKEMLEKGVEEGRWTEKFISRIQFKGDLVSACPDVSQVLLGKDAEFIILASDGLWDYMKSSDVVEFVRNQLRQHGNAQIACEALCQMALDQGSQDNISIIIADLGRTDWKNLPVKKENFVYEMGQALATMGIVSFGIWMSYQLHL